MKSRGSIWHVVKHILPGLDVRSFCFRGNSEAQSAIHIIRNQTLELSGWRKWKRKTSIHCLVIKSHFIRPPLLPRTSYLAIDKLLSGKWAQFDSKYMRHTYLTFSAKREKQVNKTAAKLSSKIAYYLLTILFLIVAFCLCVTPNAACIGSSFLFFFLFLLL